MDELRKRILLDLFVTPGTVIPATIGLSLLMMSGILGGLAAFIGFCGLLISFGSLLTNLVFNMDKISKKAMREWRDRLAKEKDAALDELDRKLVRTRDPRDQTALRNLRTIYDSFSNDLKAGKISTGVSSGMLTQIDEIFDACVKQLERQYEIWEVTQKVSGNLKVKLNSQREEVLAEVEKSVENLADVIAEVRALKLKAQSGELEHLQTRLNSQLAAAKATADFMAGLDASDMSRFSEYEAQ